ncbi:MAG: response regulator [Ignavibacteria bacterium]|nr:response regulator [Ignavibacteria bacterium]
MDKKKTIIFAEDTVHIAKLLKFKLEKEGFNLIHFASGVGVTDGVLQYMPDLVLLDIMMPVKDGLTVLKEIKSNPILSKIPVVLLTANSHEEYVVKGLQLGATDYILKPFASAELVLRIKNILKMQ